jgi:hypothetical protein
MLPHAQIVATRAHCENGVSLVRFVVCIASSNAAVISKPETRNLSRKPVRRHLIKAQQKMNFSEQDPRTNNVGPAAADLRKQVPPEGHVSACPVFAITIAVHSESLGTANRLCA